MFNNFEFVNPGFFWLLLLLPLAILWYFFKRKQETAELKISSLKGFKATPSFLPRLKPLLFLLRLLALTALIIAIARPKDVAAEFIRDRPNDRIGLVEYAGESFTKTPITSDKSIVLRSLNDIRYNTIIEGGTAIGMGLATSVNRLKDSKAVSKIIILLTDGVNNSGQIDPKIASDLAVEFGIKTYTIGLGTNGMAYSPIRLKPNGSFQYGRVQVTIDEKLLQEIADATGGKYFRATDNKKLEEIYKEINKLEKTDVEEFKFTQYEEMFRPLVLIAGLLFLLELLLRFTIFRSFV